MFEWQYTIFLMTGKPYFHNDENYYASMNINDNLIKSQLHWFGM